MVANNTGQTPLCVALAKGLPHVLPLANLPTDVVTETMYQGLYHYTLLRMAPHLVFAKTMKILGNCARTLSSQGEKEIGGRVMGDEGALRSRKRTLEFCR